MVTWLGTKLGPIGTYGSQPIGTYWTLLGTYWTLLGTYWTLLGTYWTLLGTY
jgi:hypothetical protein